MWLVNMKARCKLCKKRTLSVDREWKNWYIVVIEKIKTRDLHYLEKNKYNAQLVSPVCTVILICKLFKYPKYLLFCLNTTLTNKISEWAQVFYAIYMYFLYLMCHFHFLHLIQSKCFGYNLMHNYLKIHKFNKYSENFDNMNRKILTYEFSGNIILKGNGKFRSSLPQIIHLPKSRQEQRVNKI